MRIGSDVIGAKIKTTTTPKDWKITIQNPELSPQILKSTMFWNKPYEAVAPFLRGQGYKTQEIYDLSQVENPLDTSHWAVRLNKNARRTARRLQEKSPSVEDLIVNVSQWTHDKIQYDSDHFSASTNWRKPEIISWASTANETYRTRVGICRERSLLMVAMLRYLGVKSSLFRPHESHLAVAVQYKPGMFAIADPTFDKVDFVENRPLTIAYRKEGLYTYGVTPLHSFVLWTLARRRKLTYQKLGKKVSAEEALKAESESLKKLPPEPVTIWPSYTQPKEKARIEVLERPLETYFTYPDDKKVIQGLDEATLKDTQPWWIKYFKSLEERKKRTGGKTALSFLAELRSRSSNRPLTREQIKKLITKEINKTPNNVELDSFIMFLQRVGIPVEG